jgi:amidase
MRDIREARTDGIDAALTAHRLDALLLPSYLGCHIPARAGYPAICVPAGYRSTGEPFGITLVGTAFSEPVLIRLAYAYEQATNHWVPPRLYA